ncbi:MAG: HrpE/YscL family type III secretion apparatus protein [Christensenellales bacterium]
MFSDELEKIINSEEDAENLVKEAKITEKKILENARNQAEKIIEEAENKGKDYYQNQIDEGNQVAKTNYDNFIEDVKQKNRELQNSAENRLDEVSDFIFERIVNSSVNS